MHEPHWLPKTTHQASVKGKKKSQSANTMSDTSTKSESIEHHLHELGPTGLALKQ